MQKGTLRPLTLGASLVFCVPGEVELVSSGSHGCTGWRFGQSQEVDQSALHNEAAYCVAGLAGPVVPRAQERAGKRSGRGIPVP